MHSSSKKTLLIKKGDPLGPAVELIKNGGVVAYPTETFYGLGVDPFNKDAVVGLYDLKGRAFKDPVSIVVSDLDMLLVVVTHVPPEAERLIKKFWPGPLTLVFQANETVPLALTAGTGKIGVRIPGSKFTREFIRAVGGPVTATSANPSGKKSAVTTDEVLDYFDGQIDAVMDGGLLPGVLGSTVVDLTGGSPRLIREGEIAFSLITEAML